MQSKDGDSLFVANSALKSNEDIEIQYLERTPNAEDINKMKISDYEKKQKIFALNKESEELHYKLLGGIDHTSFFKNHSSYIGSFVKVDSTEIGAYSDINEFGDVLVEIKVSPTVRDFDPSIDFIGLDVGFVNTGRYFIKRRYLSLTDSLKINK